MATKVIGIGEIGICKNPGDSVKTYALGSCVALIIFAPKIPAVGMAHIALPDSTIGVNGRTKTLPGYFADVAIPNLINEFKRLGVVKNHEVRIKVVGGANIMDPDGHFNIGKRNLLAIKKILWQYKLGAIAEDVGASHSRTVDAQVDGVGTVVVTSPHMDDVTL
jgi:chemotaxis protein CheD